MMFATCRACGAVVGSPCYPECPITRQLGREAARERALTERIVKSLRRRKAGDADPESDRHAYGATQAGERRIADELRRFFGADEGKAP